MTQELGRPAAGSSHLRRMASQICIDVLLIDKKTPTKVR
jgi:hypothetical protein